MSDAAQLQRLLRGREPLWPQIEQTISEIWARTAQPIQEMLERTGTPNSLRGYVELGAGPLSLAEVRLRDPYSQPARFLEELAQLASDGWVEAIGEGQYRVGAQARANVEAAVRAGDTHLGTLDVLPPADLERHAALLERLVRAGSNAPEPPGEWAARPRASVVGTDVPPLGRIRAHAMDLSLRRDDAHGRAWMPLSVPGHAWNAFTLIWHGDARSAREVAALQSWRGYGADDYAAAISVLVRRGWLEADTTAGRYCATPTGEALRDEVEARTDVYFYQSWSVLNDREWDELSARQSTLRERLRELRWAAKGAGALPASPRADQPPRQIPTVL